MAEATETDIFQQQKKTIDTLVEVLNRQGQTTQPQVIYAQPAAEEKEPPNYLLYGAIGLILFILLFKK